MDNDSKVREGLQAEVERLRAEVSSLSSGSFWADSNQGLGTLVWKQTVLRFRELMSSMQAVFFEVDDQGYIAGSSELPGGFLGNELRCLTGVELASLTHEEDRLSLRNLLALNDSTTQHMFRFIHKDGDWRYFEVDVASSPDESGRRLVFCKDVTPMQHAVMALRESEDRYRALTDNATDLIIEIDDQGRFHYVSPTSREILGYAPEELEGKTFNHIVKSGRIHPEDTPRLLHGLQLRDGEGQHADDTYRIRRANGTWRWLESRAGTYDNRKGEMRSVVISRDVTDRVEAQRELEELDQRYDMLGATSRDMITESGPDNRLLYVSRSARDLLGYEPEELVGTLGRVLIHPDDRDHVRNHFWLRSDASPDVSFSPPYRCRAKDGSYRWFESVARTYMRADGTGPFVVALLRDVTERLALRAHQHELEEHVQRSQRLEGLGVMAGGIAHDFNNLLTPILGQASLALLDIDDGANPRTRLEKIRTAARRAAKLTNQMLAYAGAEPMLSEATDLSQLVGEMGQLLESTVSGKAIIRFDLAAGLSPIEADSAQISQIVMNMISNAVEAVESGSDSIDVRTHSLRPQEVDKQDLVVGELDPNVRYVCFEVEDTGVGMSPETRAKIFDPFFTTKFTGRGLGLAAVLGIVRGHNGAIELRTKPGEGTRFRVWLPPPKMGEAAVANAATRNIEWSSSGLVLVADDDPSVLEIAVDTLARCGLIAVTALNGLIAVELFRERPREIRAVLLDRTMPGLSGEAAFAQIRKIRSDVPIIMVSGYSEESLSDETRQSRVDGFLKKPFQPEDMINTLRKVLNN